MKKICIALILIGFCLTLTGCVASEKDLVKVNMSEITYNYYTAENDSFSLSISVGKRENPYFIDGIHRNVVDFSLIVLRDKTFSLKDRELNSQITINGEKSQVELEYNPIACCYMVDLGFALKEQDKIQLELNSTILLPQIVDFNVSYSKALEISTQKFLPLIRDYTSGNTLKGECYLKILSQLQDNHLFWCFTFVGSDNKSYNLILSVDDGSILASDFQ